jgi:hypothetical protein
MIPIYEQGNKEGIGHSFGTFIRRFQEICQQHVNEKRAHAFAFIFYDFSDKTIRKILKSQGGFTNLDRLSGRNLSIFYLHSDNEALNKHFNATFKHVFEIKESVELPFVLFLKFDGEINIIKDLKIVELEQENPIFAFNELYVTIEDYITQLENQLIIIKSKKNRVTQLIGKYAKMARDEFVKLVLKDGYEMIKNF